MIRIENFMPLLTEDESNDSLEPPFCIINKFECLESLRRLMRKEIRAGRLIVSARPNRLSTANEEKERVEAALHSSFNRY